MARRPFWWRGARWRRKATNRQTHHPQSGLGYGCDLVPSGYVMVRAIGRHLRFLVQSLGASPFVHHMLDSSSVQPPPTTRTLSDGYSHLLEKLRPEGMDAMRAAQCSSSAPESAYIVCILPVEIALTSSPRAQQRASARSCIATDISCRGAGSRHCVCRL